MNKRVYIVTYESGGWESYKVIEAVFSHEEAAWNYIQDQRKKAAWNYIPDQRKTYSGEYDVETWEVDKVDG